METTTNLDTFYFCMNLTESEHGCVEGDIERFLTENCPDTKVVYYRELKDGHVPMYREIKIEGPTPGLDCFKRWFSTPKLHYIDNVVRNPHKDKELK